MKRTSQPKIEGSREDFPDGSAIVTYANGSQLIIESDLAQVTTGREARKVSYREAAPRKP